MIRHIDGMIELSEPLHVHPDVLGMQAVVIIGENKGRVSLPSVPDTGVASSGKISFLQPASLGRRALPDTTLVAKFNGTWGYTSAGQSFVEAIRLHIPIGDVDGSVPGQMKEIGQKFDLWYNIVRDWVSAWSGQVRYREFNHEESHIHATIKVDGKRGLYGSGQTGGRIFIGEPMATREQVEAAFFCASKDYRIPLQYALLQRAVSDYHNRDSRQSAINACAAAEVSLSIAVRKALSSAKVADEAAGRIINRTSGVVEMFRLFIVAGGKTDVSDNRVMDQLAKPRNIAAHDGISPSSTDLERAINTAKQIVADAAPLPEPAAAKRLARKLDT